MTLNRISQLKHVMRAGGLQAIALNPSPDLIYLTGLHYHLNERPTVLIITEKDEIIAILPEFEVGKLKSASLNVKPFAYDDNPAGWEEVFKNACLYAGLNQQKIGVDPIHFRFLEFNLLKQGAPEAQFVPAGTQISSLRVCKDESEIALMRQAIQIAQKAFTASLSCIKPDVTEREIAQELTIQLMRAGGDNDSEFSPIIASGPNSANPHHTPSDRKLIIGDAIVIDWGAKYRGYYSDLTRTVVLGKPTDDFKKVFDLVAQANSTGRAAGKPGLPAGDVDKITRQVIEKAGFGVYFNHRTGHGLGMEVHEPVYIFGENTTPLEPGMTYTIEPGIYLSGRFGVRIEDNVVITSNGSQTLSDPFP